VWCHSERRYHAVSFPLVKDVYVQIHVLDIILNLGQLVFEGTLVVLGIWEGDTVRKSRPLARERSVLHVVVDNLVLRIRRILDTQKVLVLFIHCEALRINAVRGSWILNILSIKVLTGPGVLDATLGLAPSSLDDSIILLRGLILLKRINWLRCRTCILVLRVASIALSGEVRCLIVFVLIFILLRGVQVQPAPWDEVLLQRALRIGVRASVGGELVCPVESTLCHQ